MLSGISNKSRWLPRFIPNFLCLSRALSLNQRSEHPARGDHGPPENGGYAAPGMHRSPDPPQPRAPALVVSGPVQRPAPPEGTHGTVERPPLAAPAAEVRRVQETVPTEVTGGRARQPGRFGDAFDLPRHEGIFQPVLPPVRRGSEQDGERAYGVWVDLTPTIVVDEGHGLPRLLASFEASVQIAGVGRQNDAVRRNAGGQLPPERRVHGYSGAGKPLLLVLFPRVEQTFQPARIEIAYHGVRSVFTLRCHHLAVLDLAHRLARLDLDPGVPGELLQGEHDLVDAALRHEHAVCSHDRGHARVQSGRPVGCHPGVERVDGDYLLQPLRQPRKTIQIRASRQLRPVHLQKSGQCGEGLAISRIRRKQTRDLGPEPAVNAGEPFPRLVPRMTLLYRQRGSLAAKVIPSYLGQPVQLQSGDLGRFAEGPTRGVPASHEFLPHAREGEERWPRVHPPAVEFDASALPAKPRVGLEQRYLVPGTTQQCRRGQSPETTAHDHDAAHG